MLQDLILPKEHAYNNLKERLEAAFEKEFLSFLDAEESITIEHLYSIQTDLKIKMRLKDKLLGRYGRALQFTDDAKCSKLFEIILGCHLNMTESAGAVCPLKKEAVAMYFKKISLADLVYAYDSLMEEHDEYSSFVVDAFSERILETITSQTSLDLIKKVCKHHSDYSWKNVGEKVEKKLGLVFH